MWVNTITGERLKLFDLVVAFFKFYTMRVFFVCPPVAIYQKKKVYVKKDSTSVEAFTTLGSIQMEIEDIYICKSKASVHILVYLSIVTIINILV